MKNSKVDFEKLAGIVMNVKKVDPKSVSALQASLIRGSKLVK